MNYRALLSKHRGAVMGLMAMLIVVYHAHLGISNPLYRLTIGTNGSIGVDVFVLVSGFGLAYALERSCDVGRYMSRRLARLLPSYYVYVVISSFFWKGRLINFILPRAVPVGTWVNAVFPKWYVAGAVGFYVIALITYPALRRSRHMYLTAAVLLVLTCWYVPSISKMKNAALAIMRLPALVVGLTMGCAAQRPESRYGRGRLGLAGLAALFLFGMALFVFREPLHSTLFQKLDFEKYCRLRRGLVAPLLTVLAVYVFEAFEHLHLGGICFVLDKVGQCSLEMYLIHGGIYDMMLTLPIPKTVAALATVVASYPAAWLVHWLGGRLLALWRKLLPRLTV